MRSRVEPRFQLSGDILADSWAADNARMLLFATGLPATQLRRKRQAPPMSVVAGCSTGGQRVNGCNSAFLRVRTYGSKALAPVHEWTFTAKRW
jgi:hypothetical protein